MTRKSVADQPRTELGEQGNVAVISFAQVERIDVDWVQSCTLCAEHVEPDGVPDVDAARWLYLKCLERQVEDSRIRFLDTD